MANNASRFNGARLRTRSGIPYKLMDGYPKFRRDNDAFSGTEVYLLLVRDLQGFMAESFPPPIRNPDGEIIQNRNRRMPSAGILVTQDISAEPFLDQLPADPFGADSSAPDGTYGDLYVLTIAYKTEPGSNEDEDDDEEQASPETFLDQSISAGGEIIYVSTKRLEVTEQSGIDPNDPNFQGPPQSAQASRDNNIQVTKVVPTIEHTLSIKRFAEPNWKLIYGCLGTVNSGYIEPIPESFPGTCLFMGISGQRTFQVLNEKTIERPWNLDFKWSQRYIPMPGVPQQIMGWQYVYSPEDGGWVWATLNGRNLYEFTVHKDMLRATPPPAEEEEP